MLTFQLYDRIFLTVPIANKKIWSDEVVLHTLMSLTYRNVHFVMYMFRCNDHVPARDSHRRVGAAQTSAKR